MCHHPLHHSWVWLLKTVCKGHTYVHINYILSAYELVSCSHYTSQITCFINNCWSLQKSASSCRCFLLLWCLKLQVMPAGNFFLFQQCMKYMFITLPCYIHNNFAAFHCSLVVIILSDTMMWTLVKAWPVQCRLRAWSCCRADLGLPGRECFALRFVCTQPVIWSQQPTIQPGTSTTSLFLCKQSNLQSSCSSGTVVGVRDTRQPQSLNTGHREVGSHKV